MIPITTRSKLDVAASAYMAGIVDGEGAFTVGRRRGWRKPHQYQLTVRVVTTDYSLAVWIQERFGGNIVKRKTINSKWRQSWTWQISSKQDVTYLLDNIEPYLQIKNKQAALTKQFMSTRALARPVPASSYELYEEIWMHMTLLNMKGPRERRDALLASGH